DGIRDFHVTGVQTCALPICPPSEHIMNRSFISTMLLTGLLTASVSLAAFLYALQTETLETARTYAFSVLVFSELLRSFGCRSERSEERRVGKGCRSRRAPEP